MKKYFSTIFAVFCFACLMVCMAVGDVSAVSDASIYGRVLRLHVLANSDSDYDQNLKYKVRDGLLSETEKLFYGCEDVHEALEIANKNRDLLCETAKEVLRDNGCNEDVTVVIGKEHYPERTYEDLVFPEGEYLSVRVLIGEGRGQNWWCVLFPPLCNVGVEDSGRIVSTYGINLQQAEKLQKETDGGINVFGCNIKLKLFS